MVVWSCRNGTSTVHESQGDEQCGHAERHQQRQHHNIILKPCALSIMRSRNVGGSRYTGTCIRNRRVKPLSGMLRGPRRNQRTLQNGDNIRFLVRCAIGQSRRMTPSSAQYLVRRSPLEPLYLAAHRHCRCIRTDLRRDPHAVRSSPSVPSTSLPVSAIGHAGA